MSHTGTYQVLPKFEAPEITIFKSKTCPMWRYQAPSLYKTIYLVFNGHVQVGESLNSLLRTVPSPVESVGSPCAPIFRGKRPQNE